MAIIARTPDDWKLILTKCGVSDATADNWKQAFADEVTPAKFSKGESELDVFLGQILHECGMLEHMQEDLHYSAKRITQLASTSKPGTRWYEAGKRAAELAAGGPEKIANFLYANRYGNGDEASGDGWKYRGRCPIGLTFKDNYVWIGKLIGQDLDVMPNIIEQPHFALQATVAFWEGKIPDSILNNVKLITERVNGGDFGLQERVTLTECARNALDSCRRTA